MTIQSNRRDFLRLAAMASAAGANAMPGLIQKSTRFGRLVNEGHDR